jgi:hypothetical protein
VEIEWQEANPKNVVIPDANDKSIEEIKKLRSREGEQKTQSERQREGREAVN